MMARAVEAAVVNGIAMARNPFTDHQCMHSRLLTAFGKLAGERAAGRLR